MFLGNEGGFVQSGSSLTFFENGNQMFGFEEVDGQSPELGHLEGASGDVESSSDVSLEDGKLL